MNVNRYWQFPLLLVIGSVPAMVLPALGADLSETSVQSASPQSTVGPDRPIGWAEPVIDQDKLSIDKPATTESVQAKPASVPVEQKVTKTKSTAAAMKTEPAGTPEKPPADVKPTFPIANKFSQVTQKVTGITWLTQSIAGTVAEIVIRRKIGGKVDVNIKPFSATDLIAGKVKSVSVRINGSKINNVRLGAIEASTAQPIWYIPFKNKKTKRGVQSPVLISLKVVLSEKDVTDALKSPEVAAALSGLNLDLPGLGAQQLEIVKPNITIENDHVHIDATLAAKGSSAEKGVPIKISAMPKLVGGNEIVLSDLKVESPFIIEPEKFATFLSDLLNPVVRFSRYDRKTLAFRLSSMEIKDRSIVGNGSLLLAPKQDAPKLGSNQGIIRSAN